MKKYLYILSVFVLGLLFTACNDTKLNPADIDGHWANGKVPYNDSTMDMELTFYANENDSTTGEFFIHYDGKHDEKMSEDNNVSIVFSVITNGTYAINDDVLTLKYNADSTGVSINPECAKEFAKSEFKRIKIDGDDYYGENPTEEDVYNEIMDSFSGFIGESFTKMFRKCNEDGDTHIIIIEGNTLKLGSGESFVTLTKVTP